MATGKRFYWIKLSKEFMASEEIDFLMSQKNGAQYVVLYQMLCLATINTDGACIYSVGETIVPYDVDKIRRECKFFDNDTIIVALELFKKLGWVYEQENGVLRISDFNEKVGSETDWAQKKARQRLGGGDNVPQMSPPMSPEMSPQEKRDKRKELRDKSSDNNQSFTQCACACAQGEEGDSEPENGAVVDEKNDLPTAEQKKRLQQTYLGGTLGKGIVMMNMEQLDYICENYSIEEIEKYFGIITDCESKGKKWRKKTHYQAFLEMAAEDRRVSM